jgi:hypothetical protein
MHKMRRPAGDGLLDLINDLPSNLVMAEIGCYAGESTMFFLMSGKIKKLYAIDPWSSSYLATYGCRQEDKRYKFGKLDSADPNHIAKAEMVFRDMELAEKMFDEKTRGYPVVKIKSTMEDAFDKLPELDFVYIDADHNYEPVKLDINLSLKKIRHGGIIAGHDYKPKYTEGVIKAVHETFGKPDKLYKDSSWIIFNLKS